MATDEVLTAMGRSASTSISSRTIVDSARRLCRADGVQVHLVDGPVYRLARSSGLSASYRRAHDGSPDPPHRDSLTGRVGLDRRTTQIPDVLADPATVARTTSGSGYRHDHGRADAARRGRRRRSTVWRTEVDPFDERATAPTARSRRRPSPSATWI